ncbi:oligosaccharide flippase family protein [Roseateles paludis]|jgi:O-antigen/teichoic acid export membrane protein|uniref:Oligosaccharide flippase family protein n=1 Tax=Roseateles paludis TaxID=3145238 RepID=A0ABV0G1S7_9BURK
MSTALDTSGAGRAVSLHVASTALSQGIRLVSSIVLAHWVSPAEFGVWGLAMAIFGLLHLLRDLGLTTVLQRDAVLAQQQLSACLGVLAVSGAVAALLLVVAAAPLATLLGRPALAPVLWVLAPALLVAGLGSVLAAVQTRQLAARPLAWVSRVGDVVQPALALLLCTQGFGALGLAGAELGCGLACTALAWQLRTRHWAWVPRLAGARAVLRAGLPAQAGALFNHAQVVWPQWCLGLWGTAVAQGLYLRAQTLTQWLPALVMPAIGFAALPVLAERHHRGERLGPTAWQAIAVLLLLSLPLLGLLVWSAPAWLGWLLGAAWLPVLPLLAPLALTAGLQVVVMPVPAVLTALGQAGVASRLLAQGLVLRVGLGLLAVLPAHPDTALRLAWALALAAGLAAALQLWALWRALAPERLPLPPLQPSRRFITIRK